ncbi:methyltransferase domain-containing protein [Actinoplanes sp. NBRC 103695]|uniref:class I SAM-dependent methyltransferase n=1 Tax=Actinoplanes sp. NBRC 103695 TaxID=3032202 RepID=UPI0024A5ED33|nr:methyltransferase domain-containing protein [Actinoplanes sp. NBRC 103695]GLZ01359.1 hypothetical protein Acsp02_86100 [Actinoplanes sp. NBRC 103695]
MSTVFGEVADLYDEQRPGYPLEIAEVVLGYAGRPPATMAEVGAGTGKATALFAGRGIAITCVEPDPRMAEVLTARFPSVTVAAAPFERWTPPPGGVDLLTAALAWHWIEPVTRAQLAERALAPGGTLALIGRRSVHEDAGLGAAIRATYARHPPDAGERPPLPSWAVPEIREHTGLTDITTWETAYATSTAAADVLRSVRTLGPFLRRSPSVQRALLDDLRRTLEAYGAPIRTRVETAVVMARA